MHQELKSMLSAYPLTLEWIDGMENLPCGAITVSNIEREIILEGSVASCYLVPFFEFAESELKKGYKGDEQELITKAARDMNLFLMGRPLNLDKPVANVATESRAGELVFGGSSLPISSQGIAAVEICEGKRSQPEDPIYVPELYDGFMWVASDPDLERELDAFCPARNNDEVLNILSRPRFRIGHIIKIKYARNISKIEMRAPTVIDSKGMPLWRKCRNSDNWGQTVAMHNDFIDGVAEAVHSVPCILPVGTTLEMVGFCSENRYVDVEALCNNLWVKTQTHSPV